MAKNSDAVSRRRKRREADQKSVPQSSTPNVASSSTTKVSVDNKGAVASEAGTASLEEMFGLGNEQLRELMEQELPVPREDLITGQTVEKKDDEKVFSLPDLTEFVKDATTVTTNRDKKGKSEVEESTKVDRSNLDEYLRVIQLNPFADADDSIFKEEVTKNIIADIHS